MEGEPEDSDEDVQGEEKRTVIWEKCIQQSIVVDLSDDESLHLSDLENSFALNLSQAESADSDVSIHLSGSEALSALDVTSSESSSVTSQSERRPQIKSSPLLVSAPRPNTMQDEPPLKQDFEDPGQNTSDEDQDELPYDGELGSHYFSQTAVSEGNTSSDGRETVHGSPDAPFCFLECTTTDRDELQEHLVLVEHNAETAVTLTQADVNTGQTHIFDVPKPSEAGPSPCCPSDINQLLLRHFPLEDLQWSGRLIEAETLPEVSLLESVDDTVLSRAPTHNSTINHSEHHVCNSEINQTCRSDRTNEKSNTDSQKSHLEDEADRKTDSDTSAATDRITSSAADTVSEQENEDASATGVEKQEKEEEDGQIQRVQLVRARSFSEMKYGQGQVHYPLPDFSKVAPKVKIPKTPSGPSRLFHQSTMHRAQSTPEILDVISRVLEDSVLPPPEKPFVLKDKEKCHPALVHDLQAEYDKLLTKYAEAENLIDQMRIGANAQASSELMLYIEADDHYQGTLPAAEGSHLGSFAPHLPLSGTLAFIWGIFKEKGDVTPETCIKDMNPAPSVEPEEPPSDGEQMTEELRGIISQFMEKVEEFKLIVSNMSMSTAEQQAMLRSIMEAQDQLERKYISKKEEHRALEMQNYMGLSRNTGIFDPNRLVEGDIFRIGMHLEDIKEMIEQNMFKQISPLHSSSTPVHMNEMLHVKPTPLCMPTPSPPPHLNHQGPSAGFSTAGYKAETWKEDEKEAEEEEISEVYEDDGVQQSSALLTTQPSVKNTRSISCCSSPARSLQHSLQGLDIHTAEAGQERSSVLSEEIEHSNILAYLSASRSSSRQRQWSPDRCSTSAGVLNPVGECDQGDCVSLAVEVSSSSDVFRDSGNHSPLEPHFSSTSASQRIVSPETDSGFGSSYLSPSTSGSFQQNPLTESLQQHSDTLSSSGSDGSCSNLRTAIHSGSLTGQSWTSPQPTLQTQTGGAVEQWVESTTREPSVSLQDRTGCESRLSVQLHHHMSEPVLSSTMNAEGRGSPLYSCSCNSEAVLALQSEVSRLKKDLEEGLVQLPHLSQKMDYLTSKYSQDRHERRSRTRPWSQHRPASNSQMSSMWKPSNSKRNKSNLSNSPKRIEDWISSDMDPSKSKGSDSGDTAESEAMLQFRNTPAGSRITPEFQYECNESLRSSTAITGSFHSKERWSLVSSPSLQKPLLQVSYTSCSSLPASYKVGEPALQTTSHHRKRSTQSDTALLPSDVFFQRTESPGSAASKPVNKTGRRRGSKEEEMNRTLDQAIEVARSMKRTTDRMARRLSADLAKTQLHRKLHSTLPLGGRKHHAL
ncbi:uncharacterized protein V6R79_006270 [Siganus canaliculatus]